MIMGDNGNIYRLVAVTDNPEVGDTEYLEFNYDQTTEYEDRGDLRRRQLAYAFAPLRRHEAHRVAEKGTEEH